LIRVPKLKELTHPVLLQVVDGLAIQRHLHLTSFLPLLHEKMLQGHVSPSLKPTNPDALVLSQYCLLFRFYDALTNDFPKITGIDPIFEQK
jgi:hypothetical protein